MTNDLGQELPPASPRGNRLLGLAMIGLAVARGWHDGVILINYLVHHAPRMIHAPATIPWEEFSGLAFAAWPLALGVALIRSRTGRLHKAAVITGLAMGLERVLSLAIGGVFDSGWRELYRGSWDPTRGPVGPRGWKLVATVVSASAWTVLGVWAWRMAVASRARAIAEDPPSARGRRRVRPRYTNIASVVFAVAVAVMTGWGTYLTVLERLPWVRNIVIGGDGRNARPFLALDTPEGRRAREAERLFNEGQGQQAVGKFLEARQSYIKAANRYEALMEDFPKRRYYRRQFALVANNLAWFLATCPEKAVREPESAVLLARKAVAIDPDDGNAVNTLAVCHYRAGELKLSRETFERSIELRGGGDGFDWFFLAQIDAAQGKPDEARAMYDKAVAWTLGNRPQDPELFRFRVEAADRLKLPRPEMPAADPSNPARGEGPILFVPKSRRRIAE